MSRFTTINGVGSDETILLDRIPSAPGNHDGGDMHFGFDGKLYIAVGDRGAFASNSNYPSPYADAYFYGDNGAGWVHVLTMVPSNVVTNRYDFDQLGCPVSFGNGPDGSIYVADICAGAIYKYVFTP